MLDESQIDFSMNVTPFKTGYRRSWLGATCSRTVVFFYATLAAIVGTAAVIAEDL